MQVMLRIGTHGTCSSLCLALCAHHTLPIEHASLLSARLDPWQLSLKHLNSVTELLGDLVAQLVRAWQTICQVVGSSPSLSHCHFFLGMRPTCRISDFVYLYCLANRAQRRGRRTCMDVLVTSAEYHDCESSFHDLKGYKS